MKTVEINDMMTVTERVNSALRHLRLAKELMDPKGDVHRDTLKMMIVNKRLDFEINSILHEFPEAE